MILGLSKNWSIANFSCVLILCLPVGFLFLQAIEAQDEIFQHLRNTVLLTYIKNTLLIMLFASFGASILAIPAAWFVSRCHFPCKNLFKWALLLPLAMPTYLVAYIYTDLFDYAGPIQRFFRQLFNWHSPQDYYFPEIRSLAGTGIIFSLLLFPYIFLLLTKAFKEQSLYLQQAARISGCNSWQIFWRLNFPIARPALAVGITLVAMETAADFATVNYFAIPTLTTGIYDAWLEYGSLASASKLAVIMLLVIFSLISVERIYRRKQSLFQYSSAMEKTDVFHLSGIKAWGVFLYCGCLLFMSFLLPMGVLINYVYHYFSLSWSQQLWTYSLNSLLLAIIVSLSCLFIALLFMFVHRVSPRSKDKFPAYIASSGYAIPATVIAIGALIVLIQLDFALNTLFQWFKQTELGLIVSGSLFALVFALCIRFVAISIGSIESSYKHLPSSYDSAAISLGCSPTYLFFKVHFPLLKKGMITALLLVFIETMKELPASLLLKPIGYENLATHVYQFLSDEQLEQGALGAIMIVLVGLIPVYLLNKQDRE